MSLGLEVILRVIEADVNSLSRDIKPLILRPHLFGLASEPLKIGDLDMWWREGLIALEEHVQQSLDVHNLVLEAQPDGPGHCPGNITFVETQQPSPHSVLIPQDFIDRRPFLRHFGMVVALLGVINVRIDASFEDARKIIGFGAGLPRHFGQLNVQEGGNVAKVEDAGVAKADRLFAKLLLGKHAPGDYIPCLPQRVPVGRGRDVRGGVEAGLARERHTSLLKQVDTYSKSVCFALFTIESLFWGLLHG